MANLIKSNPRALIKRAQEFISENASAIEVRQTEVAQQSPIWLRASLWTLMATAGFGITWLALAQTDEVVVAMGKLEPIGDVKEIRVPLSGVVDQILTREGERVEKGQTLLRLDTESSSQRQKTLTTNVSLKQSQLNLKQEELNRYLKLNDTEQEVLRNNIELQNKILNRFLYLNSQGATSEIQLLQQRERLQQLKGEVEMKRDDRQRQRAVLEQQIEQLKANLEIYRVNSQSKKFACDIRRLSPLLTEWFSSFSPLQLGT